MFVRSPGIIIRLRQELRKSLMCLSCVFHVSLKDPYGVSQRSLSCLFFSTLRIIHQNFGAENTLSCLNDGSYPTVRAPLTAVSSTLAWFRVPGYS